MGDETEGGERRPSPAEVNAAGNRSRLSRIEQIGRVADGRRASEMVDVDGERPSGRFADGEFDESPEARERQAQREEDEARQALEDQAERARLEAEEEAREARRLQEEGGEADDTGRGDAGAPVKGGAADDGADPDEKVVDGVRYYRTMVNGAEKWLTLKELRAGAAASAMTEETLQRAQEALQRATQAELTPKEAPAEVDDTDLENIILSAGMGDEEAVRKLATIVRSRPKAPSATDVKQEVSQQIATQREVDRAEQAQQELLSNEILAPVFRQRLNAFAAEKPKTKIVDAYRAVGDQMRKDFAAMLQQNGGRPPSKDQRKRTIVNPPQSAGRQVRREEDDREVPVADQIDAIARSRGQVRAHRVRRS